MNMIQAFFAAEMGKNAAMAINFNDLETAQKINDEFEKEIESNIDSKADMVGKFIETYCSHSNRINWFALN